MCELNITVEDHVNKGFKDHLESLLYRMETSGRSNLMVLANEYTEVLGHYERWLVDSFVTPYRRRLENLNRGDD